MGHTSSMTARPISRSAFLAYVGFLILLAFLVLFNVRLFVTSGPSMEPTYTEGEVLFAVRLYGEPQAGDAVLIQKDGTTYMKRVAYVAGEDVSLRQTLHYTYMLRCADGTLYTGWTKDLQKRVAAHNAGTGARYTRGRRPVTLVYYEAFPSKAEAMRREYAVKQLSREEKEALLSQFDLL